MRQQALAIFRRERRRGQWAHCQAEPCAQSRERQATCQAYSRLDLYRAVPVKPKRSTSHQKERHVAGPWSRARTGDPFWLVRSCRI